MDSIQTAVGQNPTIGVEGIFADSGFKDVLSGLSSSRKLVSVAITAADSQDFTITINGTVHTYASDGSATTAEIAVGLAALINAGAQASKVTATGTDTPLLIESDIDGPDGDFTYSDAAGGGGARCLGARGSRRFRLGGYDGLRGAAGGTGAEVLHRRHLERG